MARRRVRRRKVKPGTAPGTLKPRKTSASPTIRAITYNGADITDVEIDGVEDLRPLMQQGRTVWIDIVGLGDVEVIEQLGDYFKLHRLALEDVMNLGQRAKLEDYQTFLFIVVPMFELDQSAPIEHEQLSLFLGEGFVITIQERAGDPFKSVRDRLRKNLGRVRRRGADYLTYALVDSVVDHYMLMLEGYDDVIEQLEDEVMTHPTSRTAEQIHGVKRQLRSIWRTIWPMRSVVETLMNPATEEVTDETRTYLRDCHDHLVRSIDLLDSFSEYCTDLTNLYISSVNHRMNEVMRVLTVVASIFIPLTFIAGIYGMNFNPEASPLNMPELNWYFGYPAAWLLMLGLTFVMIFYFWRKGWLTEFQLKRAEKAEEEVKRRKRRVSLPKARAAPTKQE